MAISKLNDQLQLLKVKPKDDQLKELQHKTEKHDQKNILRSLKIDDDFHKKKYKSLNKKKVLLILTEKLKRSASTISSSTLSILNPGVGVTISSSSALLTYFAILITNECISKF